MKLATLVFFGAALACALPVASQAQGYGPGYCSDLRHRAENLRFQADHARTRGQFIRARDALRVTDARIDRHCFR